MPSVVVITTRIYTTFPVPKGVTLRDPHKVSNSKPGPKKPWSWHICGNILTYWDEKGGEHKVEGEEQEYGDAVPEDTRIDDGKDWGYDSEDEETVCEFCDLPEVECVTQKADGWSDCRGYRCAPPDGHKEKEQYMKDMMSAVTKGARECGATQDNAVKAMDILREMCKANPSLIEVTKKSK